MMCELNRFWNTPNRNSTAFHSSEIRFVSFIRQGKHHYKIGAKRITILRLAINDAPEIDDFTGVNNVGDIYIFSGSLSDVDDDPVGQEVSFFDLAAGSVVTIESDLTFELIIDLAPNPLGDVSASTVDNGGLASDVRTFFVV